MQTEDQTTTNTDETNSNQTTDTSTEQSGSTSSTTDQTSDRVDLGGDDTSTSTQTEDTRTDEQKAADTAHEALFGAPAEDASYAIEGLPEGMEIDKDALDAVAPTFRELDLSNEGASKIAQVYAEKVLPKVMEQATKAIETQVIAQRTAWEDEAKAAIQSNGADLKNAAGEVLSFDAKAKDAVLATAAKALDRLAPAGFREFLKDTGLAVNPGMVALCYQAGKLLAEDSDLETGATTKTTTSPSRVRNAGGMDPNKFFDK